MAKGIYDYGDDEIASMTDAQINTFIDIECALQGFPLLPEYPVEPEKPRIKATKQYYSVAGLWFETQEEALEVLKVISGKKLLEVERNWQLDFHVVKLRPSYNDSQNELKLQTALSETENEQHKQEIKVYERLKNAYNSAKKNYEDAYNKRRKIIDDVWEVYSRAKEIAAEKQKITNHFETYEKLLGDREAVIKIFPTVMGNLELKHNHEDFIEKLCA